MQKLNLNKIIVSVSTFSIILFLPYLPVSAIEYGGFGGRPAYPRADNPRTDSIFVHSLEPGATKQEGVKVVNNSPETKTMIVYGADSTPSTGGAFACKQLAEENTDVGSWITLEKGEITLDPGTNDIIPFTIDVPQNASVGEHNGCILIQEKKDPVPGATGAVLSVRTGLRVAITIPGDITRQLEVVGFTIEKTKTGFVLHPLVKNTGNVSIDADVQAITQYFFGKTYFKHGGQYPILRGDTSEWNFELPKPFWGGWFRSNFTVEYDANSGAGVGVESGKTLTRLSGKTLWFFSFPAPLALLIEIVVLLIFIFLLYLLFLLLFRKKERIEKIKARVRKIKKIHRKN